MIKVSHQNKNHAIEFLILLSSFNMGMLELSYIFQAWDDDSSNSKAQFKERQSITIIRKPESYNKFDYLSIRIV